MQSSYKPYHNTETLLLNITNYISHNIKNNRFLILILLDLTAAFDTINHNILFTKLQSIAYNPLHVHLYLTYIIKHITTNSLDNTMQSAYKPYHNTETLLLNLTNYISHNIKNNRFLILILLDLTAAFDTINHNILFTKLQSIEIHNTIIQLIKSYLTG